jgi:branched-chain amino acid transport system substrate-binding protein
VLRRALALCLVLAIGASCTGDDEPDRSERTEETGAADEVKIGALFDLSGPTADAGTPYSKGVRDYVEYRNGKGGVEGHTLALTWQDFAYQVPRAEQLYASFVSQGVQAIVGWAADDTDALRPRVTADKIPYMSASYTESLADPAAAPYNFFPGTSYSQQMRIALQWIADESKGNPKVEVALFHHDSPFGASPLDAGRRYIIERQPGINLKSYPMPATATDYIAQITQAKAQGARYVIIQNVSKPAAQLARDLAGEKSTAQVLCLNWCADDLFVKLAGPAAEKVIGVTPFAPPVDATQALQEMNTFLAAKSTDAAAEGVHYVKGWFTMATMVEGIANALQASDGKKLDGEAIKVGLERIGEFRTGISAPVKFSAQNHAGMTAAPLYRIENCRFKKLVDPIQIVR